MDQMYNTHPSIINQLSRLYSQIAKLECKFSDILAKLTAEIIWSAHEQVIRVWVIASSGARRDGRYTTILIYAAAETSRGFGGTYKRLLNCARGHYAVMTPKQRAGRWRAAYPLTDDDGVLDGEDGTGNPDDDGKINCIDTDADNDGILDGTELGKTTPISDNPNGGDDEFPINGTDLTKGYFVPDEDPLRTTSHTDSDDDNDGLDDGNEDLFIGYTGYRWGNIVLESKSDISILPDGDLILDKNSIYCLSVHLSL